MKNSKQLLQFTLSLLVFLVHDTQHTFAQLTNSTSDSSSSPPDIVKILQKAGHFTAFLRLLRTTHMTAQIMTQLKASSSGLTLLAPTDAAFASLRSGALNTLNDKQQVQLVQFHVVSTFLSMDAFQTVSNPLRTVADGMNDGQFPLNITFLGNDVVLSTGIDSATVGTELYSNGKLAVFELDKVLLPPALFPPAPPPSAPKVEKPVTSPTVSSALKIGAGAVENVVRGFAAVGVAAVVLSTCSL